MWCRVGRQVMINTPGNNKRAYGLGAVNYFTGETVMITRDHKRRTEVVELLMAILEKHQTGTIYLVLDNCNTHSGKEINTVLKEANGRLVLLYLPTYSPWLNPIERLWQVMRYAVTHGELFESLEALLAVFLAYFETVPPHVVLSAINKKVAEPV
jgi:putative transposase